jgi:hypothetical protein
VQRCLVDASAENESIAQSIGMAALRDLSVEVSKSVEDVVKTATNHFNKFLVRLNGEDAVRHPYSSYKDILNKEYFTKEIFGLFTHYLLDDLKVKKCQTALGYLSKIKCQIERDMDLDLEKKKWYSDLRSKITTHYLTIASREGTKLVDSAPTMTERDLELMCGCLLDRGTREDLESRALLSWQWQSLGRISEISRVKCADIKPKNSTHIRGCISTTLTRMKTGVQQDLLMFLHASSYKVRRWWSRPGGYDQSPITPSCIWQCFFAVVAHVSVYPW